ncbi:MAG: response regulator [Bacteroides sp.]|nr:response regulator [Bacteroides sp.]
MAAPSRFTKIKIAAGYLMLLLILFFSLRFVWGEMEILSASDEEHHLQSDSLLLLIREKDEHMLRLIRTLNEANEAMISPAELEDIIAQHDSFMQHQQQQQQRVQYRVVTKTDSLIAPQEKKRFIRRLAEAFSPSRQDSSLVVNTSEEVVVDTIIETYTPVDSLQYRLLEVTQERRARSQEIQNRNYALRRLNRELTERIDSLISQYEEEMVLRSQQQAEQQQQVRQHSARVLGGMAIGAVILSLLFFTVIWKDITRSNRYRRELEVARRKAEELVEAREKLMLTITHDFKAPLSSVIGFTDLLSRLTVEERQRFYLESMKKSSQHLLKLVNDLLDFHRLDLNKAEVHRVSFNPYHFFEELGVSYQPVVDNKGLAFRIEIAEELDGNYISDPLRLRQILDNLLSNAIKFTSQGEIVLVARYEHSRLLIRVADTGQGMDKEGLGRIFKEFTRLPGAQGEEGFGLGLSIVHKLVKLLDGTIHVDSQPGEGTVFTVNLPLFPVGGEGSASAIAHHEEPAEADRLSTDIRVLVIDDDKMQLDLTAALFEQLHIHAVFYEHPDQLLEHLRNGSFDVLLTDVQMPAMNGFDLLTLLRASQLGSREIPVVAVTARSDMDEATFLEHGFTACLHKPFSLKELYNVLSKVTSLQGQLRLPQEKEGHTPQPTSRFSALLAFSAEDPVAARGILDSFIEETGKNREILAEAVRSEEAGQITAMAHKLLPIFTMLEVRPAIELLTSLERRREQLFSEEMRSEAQQVIDVIGEVLSEAMAYRDLL